MSIQKVLIITSGSFPYGTPRALRIRAFIRLFNAININVCVYSDSFSGIDNGKTFIKKDNIHMYSLGNEIIGLKKISLPLLFKKKLEQILLKENVDMIFSNCLYDRFYYIKQMSNKYELPLVIDCNEWYDPSTFKYGKFSWHYIFHSYCWKKLYPKVNGVVAISRLIEQHYRHYMNNVIRIPTIVDELDSKYIVNKCDSNTIRLLFAGSLARTKDSIKPFFQALELISKEQQKRFLFEICGVSETELKLHLGNSLYEKYRCLINNHGLIPQEKIAEMYMQCDYGIFFRPNQRSSHAGFSTKLGEGMSLGTPFIVNDTSDISLYIKNGVNGFIVNDINDITNVYLKIINMPLEEYQQIRYSARKTAETNFYFDTYKTKFEEFFKSVMQGEKNNGNKI